MTDIVELTYDQLEQLLQAPNYSLAHNAIRERLELIEAAQAEIPEMKEQQEDFSAAEIKEAANAKPIVANNAVFKTPESGEK